MIRLLHLCIFLSLTANCANAETVSVGVLTLSDHNLTCCHQNTSQCSFHTDSGEIVQPTAIIFCYELIVSEEKLLQSIADQQLLTTVNVYCKIGNGNHTSPNNRITVCTLSGKHAFMLLVILGILILFFLLILILICIWHTVTKKQGHRGQFHPVSAQELDTDTQGLNPGTNEEQEEKAEAQEDEIFYATVNHPGSAGSSAVKFESGTDYATVVIN